MPETAVEIKICDICGAEIRDGSLFCYNCGGSVSKAQTANEAVEPVATANGESRVTADRVAASEKQQGRRRRAANRGPVEVVWEPRTGVSAGFIVGSLIFLLIAVALFLAANYLK